jgi:hypothetical protein
MSGIKVGATLSLWLAAISAVIATVSLFGLILQDDIIGRLIFGTVWTLVGVYWIGSYLTAKNREKLKQNISQT